MFKEIESKLNEEDSKTQGGIVLKKVTKIVNEIGSDFLSLNGSQLSNYQVTLAGYKFYLADHIGAINVRYESLKLELKNIRAVEWDRITEEIKARDGKVKNKDQIENEYNKMTQEKQYLAMLNETLYFKYKLKISSIDSIFTAITQRIAFLKKELDQQV